MADSNVTVRNTKVLEGTKPRRFRILTLNCGTNSKLKATADERRNEAFTILDIEPYADLIFLQEIPGPGKFKKLLGKQTISRDLHCSATEAGISYHDETITLKKKIDSDKKSEAASHVSLGADLNSRSAVAFFTVKTEVQPYDILAISWHGPHTGYNCEKKKIIIHLLQNYSLEIWKKYGSTSPEQIIIGGDFNIDLRTIQPERGFSKFLKSNQSNGKYIDGFLAYGLTVQGVSSIKTQLLDHQAQKAVLSLISSEE